MSVDVECDEDEITLRMWNQDFSAVRTVTPADARRIKQHASSPLAPANSREVKEARSKQKKLDRVSAMKKLYMNQPSGGGGGELQVCSGVARPKSFWGTKCLTSNLQQYSCWGRRFSKQKMTR